MWVLGLVSVLMDRAQPFPVSRAGLVCWGLHLAARQGLLAAMIADCAPAALRGTAYGIFNLGIGLAMLAASVVAGVLWDRMGATSTFQAGMEFAVASLLVLLARGR